MLDNYDFKAHLIAEFGLSESLANKIVELTTVKQYPLYCAGSASTSSLVKHLQHLFNIDPQLLCESSFPIEEDYRLAPHLANLVGEKVYCVFESKVYHLTLFSRTTHHCNDSFPSINKSSLNNYTLYDRVRLINDKDELLFVGSTEHYKLFATLQEVKDYIFSELSDIEC